MVDRTLCLRSGSVEVQDESLAALVLRPRLRERDALDVEHRLVDAVVLGVVLPRVLTDRDLAEDLATVRLGGRVHHRVEARLDGVDAVALEQFGESTRTHQARRALGVEVSCQRIRHTGVTRHDAQCRLVGNSLVPQFDRRNHQSLFVHRGGAGRHGAGAATADVVVVTECLNERNNLRLGIWSDAGEDRHRDAEVGEMADATFGQVDVVVEVHVSRLHRLEREVPGDRMDQRGIRTARELAEVPVVNTRAEVVSVTDHR